MNLAGKRLLICEEALMHYDGHFHAWVKSIKHINEQAGVKVETAGSKFINETIEKDLSAKRVYSKNSWDNIYHCPQPWKRYLGVIKHNRLIYKETKTFLESIDPADCVLVPAARIHHLIAWRRLCKKFLGKKFKRLVIFIITSEAVYNEDYTQYSFKKSSNLIKHVLRSFKDEIASGEVVFAGDSQITSEEYKTLSNVPFKLFPSPGMALSQALLSSNEPRPGNNELVFSILGLSVYDKGIDAWQEVVIRFLERNSSENVKFVFQWAQPTISYEGERIYPDERLINSDKVTVLREILSEQDYNSYFKNSDFIVLPYRLKTYFNRTSGVMVEAACSGIPVIVTENTWLSWAMKEYGVGLTAKEADVDDLYNKLLYAINHQKQLKKEAEARRPLALECHSTEKYLHCLWNGKGHEEGY
ncbi:glycosyltransferase [Opitutia bacterium ISCC 51]|nr:glycosyltransferase [Opitutae bacterium ISCC 51]QXD30190.1 glycosyltransferase [Opitutae bacterium ISCC 52]